MFFKYLTFTFVVFTEVGCRTSVPLAWLWSSLATCPSASDLTVAISRTCRLSSAICSRKLQQRKYRESKGPFKCYVTLFSRHNGPHALPRNANNVESYTFGTLFSRKCNTPPHLHYVTLERPLTLITSYLYLPSLKWLHIMCMMATVKLILK